MSDVNTGRVSRRSMRHRGRLGQITICLGKLMRGFVYQNDWKVMPMAAIIAMLVSMVVRKDFFITMEGTLKGAFALTCVSIWNGCFNSIQVVCRERSIVKREHRAGMHISSYIIAHMVYQALLCLAQSILTLYVCRMMGVKFPTDSFLYSILGLCVTVFIISYASDMLSLLVSCVAHTTTGAMTVMPFLLIFQLVFSGGIFNLPAWTKPLTNFTFSNYGLKCIAAQSNYNNLPMVTAWNTLNKVKDDSIDVQVTLGQVIDLMQNDDVQIIHDLRDQMAVRETTVGEAVDALVQNPQMRASSSAVIVAESTLPDGTVQQVTLTDVLDMLQSSESESIQEIRTHVLVHDTTVGEAVDQLAGMPGISEKRDAAYSVQFSIAQLMDLVGEDVVKEAIESRVSASARVEAYDSSYANIAYCWARIIVLGMVCAIAAVIVLEFIDKDKR